MVLIKCHVLKSLTSMSPNVKILHVKWRNKYKAHTRWALGHVLEQWPIVGFQVVCQTAFL